MDKPSFNLWTEPWVTVERDDGSPDTISLKDTLLQAHRLRALYDPSPLVVVGVHRLLTAILQDAFDPQYEDDLADIWHDRQFSKETILQFGTQYAHRFDLFSETEPFMQSADLPLQPDKNPNYAARLFHEIPNTDDLVHFYHGLEENRTFCKTCMAKGLVTLSAFAKADGRGYTTPPSGMGPVYVIPNGELLFENLVLSLIVPDNQPQARNREQDLPWWKRSSEIEAGKSVFSLGYLYSLTFPIRRVRLYPEYLPEHVCVCCSRPIEWGVRAISWAAGERYAKDAANWLDPFAAYAVRMNNKTNKEEVAVVRFTKGKALWRDYATLFLRSPSGQHIQPGILRQLHILSESEQYDLDLGRFDADTYPVRCVSFRPEPGKAGKIAEWLDTSFQLPIELLDDYDAEIKVSEAIDFANKCERTIAREFDKAYKGNAKKSDRNKKAKANMLKHYWRDLAAPFMTYIYTLANLEGRDEVQNQWIDVVVDLAKDVFRQACDLVGSSGTLLILGARAQESCHKSLNIQRRKYKG